jgi:hypothetical protein
MSWPRRERGNVQFCNDGLTLSFDSGGVPSGEGLRITARPRNASNVVLVHYRVNDGRVLTIRAHEMPGPWSADKQVFQARFPSLPPGALVEYLPVCACAGRQVPSASVRDLSSAFRVPELTPTVPAAPGAGARRTHPFTTEHLATFTVFVREPEIIGETPEGLKVNWWVKSGSFDGPRLRGRIRPEGADWMTIRRDGVGILEVRATLETHDGALISASYSGIFELGEDGYESFLAGKYPQMPQARTTPRYVTADPRYSWLNRLQCIAAGSVDMETLSFVYDSFAFR